MATHKQILDQREVVSELMKEKEDALQTFRKMKDARVARKLQAVNAKLEKAEAKLEELKASRRQYLDETV